METYYAPPDRASDEELTSKIEIVSGNPVVSGLLHSISGLIAILNEHRQIVALNDSFLQVLGIEDPANALGLRHGEVLNCIHTEGEPAGCGTTKYCSTCGAAVAIVSSLESNKPIEKICALSANRGDKTIDIALLVKAHPIVIDQNRFLLIFLQDITRQEQRAALERTFFHDINNMLYMLLGSGEMLVNEHPSELANAVYQASIRIHKEIAIQRCLTQSESCSYQTRRHDTSVEQILSELQSFFINHPAAMNKNIEYQERCPAIRFNTDLTLLLRVLCNMIINALEATEANDTIKAWTERIENQIVFYVWNAQEIPEEISNRIFQRNFSTKEQAGRGIGTFSMKLLGEEILGGKVEFFTSKNEGTVFSFSHPV